MPFEIVLVEATMTSAEAVEIAETAETAVALDVLSVDSVLETANESLGQFNKIESNLTGELSNSESLIDKANESLGKDSEVNEKQGGRFGDIFKEGEGNTKEVHHMPADSTTKLERGDGPAIKMDKADHRETASCGNSTEAQEYRAQQKQLVSEGKVREAIHMDIDDIHEKFGDKYDDAISQMLDYVDQIEKEGKI